MKHRRFSILSSAFACFSTITPAFAATLVVDNDFLDCPRADFNSIKAAVGAAQPGDKILVCPGVYPEKVVVDKPDLRIEAQAAPGDVVLQGTAEQKYGFHLLNTTGVLLQGFKVQGYDDANILIEGGSANTLRKNVTTAGIVDGIELLNTANNVVEQNISFANKNPVADGIFVSGSSANIIRHNETFQNGQAGINLFRSGACQPPLEPCAGNVVFGNRSYANARGIQNVVLSQENLIENNYVAQNNLGILIANSTAVTARNNRSESNNSAGIILVNGAVKNLVEKNELFRNVQDGIRLAMNTDENVVQLNLVRRSGRDGIRVQDEASHRNMIERNVIRESGENDAHDGSFGTGTGGTANFWINNKCETDNRGGLLCENQF